ncbi:MAG: peptidylprolyl isomerase [Ponticaulis sp.]|nr:peptidylprolyl isomerase [Ponticaulis sp.]
MRAFRSLCVSGFVALSVFGALPLQAEDAEAPSFPSEGYRMVDPANLLIMELEYGTVVIELNDDFAPGHVAQIREFVRDGIYDGQRFYRVIDGFVAQGGLENEARIAVYPTVENENDRPIVNRRFVALGNDDLFAPEVGHIDGFPVGRDLTLGREWLLHCPGALAMARDTDPDSGSTEFYIVLAPQRYLDRNLTVFGRVISGMQYVQKLKRGDRAIESGVIQAPEKGDTILSMTIAADLPEAERPVWEVMDTQTEAFEEFKTSRRVRDDPFFYRKPPEVLDVCSVEVPAKQLGPVD